MSDDSNRISHAADALERPAADVYEGVRYSGGPTFQELTAHERQMWQRVARLQAVQAARAAHELTKVEAKHAAALAELGHLQSSRASGPSARPDLEAIAEAMAQTLWDNPDLCTGEVFDPDDNTPVPGSLKIDGVVDLIALATTAERHALRGAATADRADVDS